VKRYEGLFILNTAAKEEGIKDVIDKVSAEIASAGGKVETVQKMDKKHFARVADKKHTAGFFVNVIFDCPETATAQLRQRLAANDEIFRVLLTIAPAPKPEALQTR
jgi:ribosomal protein S6